LRKVRKTKNACFACGNKNRHKISSKMKETADFYGENVDIYV